MQIVKFYKPVPFCEGNTDEEKKRFKDRRDTILLSAKRQNAQLKVIDDWTDQVLRNYLKQFVVEYRDYEENGVIKDPRTEKEIEFHFKQPKPLPLDMKRNGKAFDGVATFPDKRLAWLQMSIPFGQQKVELLNRQKGLQKVSDDVGRVTSVGQFLYQFYKTLGKQALLKADFEDIDEQPEPDLKSAGAK